MTGEESFRDTHPNDPAANAAARIQSDLEHLFTRLGPPPPDVLQESEEPTGENSPAERLPRRTRYDQRTGMTFASSFSPQYPTQEALRQDWQKIEDALFPKTPQIIEQVTIAGELGQASGGEIDPSKITDCTTFSAAKAAEQSDSLISRGALNPTDFEAVVIDEEHHYLPGAAAPDTGTYSRELNVDVAEGLRQARDRIFKEPDDGESIAARQREGRVLRRPNPEGPITLDFAVPRFVRAPVPVIDSKNFISGAQSFTVDEARQLGILRSPANPPSTPPQPAEGAQDSPTKEAGDVQIIFPTQPLSLREAVDRGLLNPMRLETHVVIDAAETPEIAPPKREGMS